MFKKTHTQTKMNENEKEVEGNRENKMESTSFDLNFACLDSEREKKRRAHRAS